VLEINVLNRYLPMQMDRAFTVNHKDMENMVATETSGGSRNIENGGPLQKGGGGTPKIAKTFKYFGSQILSFTNFRL
jgi:hypothetical protein